MSVKSIINIIIGGTLVVSLTVIITLACLLGHYNNLLTAEKIKNNYLTQTVDKMKGEAEKRNEIMTNQEKLLEQIKDADTYQEYLSVWQEINHILTR